jgi:hypothetical protein
VVDSAGAVYRVCRVSVTNTAGLGTAIETGRSTSGPATASESLVQIRPDAALPERQTVKSLAGKTSRTHFPLSGKSGIKTVAGGF